MNLKIHNVENNKGLTLIELLIAMVISAILIAAIYRTFIRQQKSYMVQEQVIDMQQNVRVAINKMIREIRMAGLGNVSGILPPLGQPFEAIHGPYNSIITPGDNANHVGQNDDQITIIGAFEPVSTLEEDPEEGKEDIIKLAAGGVSGFDLAEGKYLCIGGIESHTIKEIVKSNNTVTLSQKLINKFKKGTAVYKVKAIIYRLRPDHSNPNMPILTREDDTDGGGSQPVAENIEDLQIRYIVEDGSEHDSPADPSKIRMVRITAVARTNMSDPEFKAGTGGFRRRTISSSILLRNMGSGS